MMVSLFHFTKGRPHGFDKNHVNSLLGNYRSRKWLPSFSLAVSYLGINGLYSFRGLQHCTSHIAMPKFLVGTGLSGIRLLAEYPVYRKFWFKFKRTRADSQVLTLSFIQVTISMDSLQLMLHIITNVATYSFQTFMS